MIYWIKKQGDKMTPKEEIEMWEKLHKEDPEETHFTRAKKIVASWPKWKQDCPYSSSSDVREYMKRERS